MQENIQDSMSGTDINTVLASAMARTDEQLNDNLRSGAHRQDESQHSFVRSVIVASGLTISR